MDRRGKSKSTDDSSLCERSMKVVSNIIRISSFSLAQRTLGITTKAPKEEDVVAEKEALVVVTQSRGSRRSQEPQNRPNRTYVIKPGGGTDEENEISSHHHHHVIHHEKVLGMHKKEECVDGLASDYIKKIRNQIGCGW